MTDFEKKIVDKFKERIPYAENLLKDIKNYQGERLVLPVFIDGVIDAAVWSFKEKRFIELIITVAEGDIERRSEDTAYCDKFKYVNISL